MTIIINPYAVQPAGGGDPFWANVVSLLHLNGTNGSTTITDETGRSWSAVGTAAISTAQSKFGGASLGLDGSGARITTADSLDFMFGADFTIEAQVRRAASGIVHTIAGQWGATVGNRSWLLFIDTDNFLKFASHTTGGSIATSAVTTINTWHHVSASRVGTNVYVSVDGVVTSSVLSGSLQNSPQSIDIGSYDAGASGRLNGFVDELRITKGVGRYNANFTPPTAEFPNFA